MLLGGFFSFIMILYGVELHQAYRYVRLGFAGSMLMKLYVVFLVCVFYASSLTPLDARPIVSILSQHRRYLLHGLMHAPQVRLSRSYYYALNHRDGLIEQLLVPRHELLPAGTSLHWCLVAQRASIE
ncbi:hypothetical protein BV20DRAFT_116447 [Pilatotrama ljubarskyi]|nr:hypothetical protein BV20DRAFT_116447 [Pilatotrama ljubarskyi]